MSNVTGGEDSAQVISDFQNAYKAATGSFFKPHVEYRNGWFIVESSDGAETRYRRRQLIFKTEQLREDPSSAFQSQPVGQPVEAASDTPKTELNWPVIFGLCLAFVVLSSGRSKPATCGHFKTSQSEAGDS